MAMYKTSWWLSWALDEMTFQFGKDTELDFFFFYQLCKLSFSIRKEKRNK